IARAPTVARAGGSFAGSPDGLVAARFTPAGAGAMIGTGSVGGSGHVVCPRCVESREGGTRWPVRPSRIVWRSENGSPDENGKERSMPAAIQLQESETASGWRFVGEVASGDDRREIEMVVS